MINVDVLSVGFDEPSISAIILARPSFSVRWMYQAVGRGVRIDPNNPDKILKVYDIVGLTSRFGKIENIRLGKEIDGFRDRLESDKGTLTNKALWEFSPDMVKVSKKWDNLI
jgi:superfamily II DNA or RNA helicase